MAEEEKVGLGNRYRSLRDKRNYIYPRREAVGVAGNSAAGLCELFRRPLLIDLLLPIVLDCAQLIHHVASRGSRAR